MLELRENNRDSKENYDWQESGAVKNERYKIMHHHVYGDFNMDTVVGSIVQNPKNPALWGIRNEDNVNWTYQKADGTQIPVEPGRTAGIVKGVKILFSQMTGYFE